jgi:hypothetical protein
MPFFLLHSWLCGVFGTNVALCKISDSFCSCVGVKCGIWWSKICSETKAVFCVFKSSETEL